VRPIAPFADSRQIVLNNKKANPVDKPFPGKRPNSPAIRNFFHRQGKSGSVVVAQRMVGAFVCVYPKPCRLPQVSQNPRVVPDDGPARFVTIRLCNIVQGANTNGINRKSPDILAFTESHLRLDKLR
jgi:hypothetical protein